MAYHAETHVKYPRYIWRKVLALDLLKKHYPPPATFLELGCGAGDFGFSLGRRGYRGTMIDFSDDVRPMIEAARQNVPRSQVDFQVVDFRSAWPEIHPNIVIAFEVLEHVADDQELVARIAQFLPTGGAFLVSVPAHQHQWGDSDVAAGHYRRYEREQLRNLLKNHGLEPIALWSYGFPFLLFFKLLRDQTFRETARAQKNTSHDERSKVSGIHKRWFGLARLLGRESVWRAAIELSRPFNNRDWSEGYLCLAKKK